MLPAAPWFASNGDRREPWEQLEGTELGSSDGAELGSVDGAELGTELGSSEGDEDGTSLGAFEGHRSVHSHLSSL